MRLGQCGSPPRGWGKRAGKQGRIPDDRFTPTRVGKTQIAHIVIDLLTVHPHAGGENCGDPKLTRFGCRFTPTRVGKTRVALQKARAERFTPTRVGKTTLAWQAKKR